MCEALSELNFLSPVTFDHFGGFEFGFGVDESVTDMLLDNLVVPGLAITDVSSYPGLNENLNEFALSDDLLPEMTFVSNYNHLSKFEQLQHHEQEWETFSVPSVTTSIPFEGVHVNSIPTGYEEPRFYETKFVNGRKRRASHQLCTEVIEYTTPDQKVDRLNSIKPKRKRVQNARQRKEANVRERKRMDQFNDAFDSLKTKVPTFTYEERLTRMETLKLAMSYISFMTQLLEGKKSEENALTENELLSLSIADMERFESTSSSYVSDGTDNPHSGSITY